MSLYMRLKLPLENHTESLLQIDIMDYKEAHQTVLTNVFIN